MAWFDILSGIGEATEQSTNAYQRMLLQARELEERRRQQAEEQRRWDASERRAGLAEQRAAAAEGRAQEQFALGLRREKEANAEQQLRAYGADPIPADVIAALRTDAPNAVKNLVRKTPTGDYKLRLSPKEELDITTATRANQLLSIPEADIAKQPLAARKELGKMRGDDAMYLTPKEVEAEVRRSPGYLISQMQMKAYEARQNVVSPAEKQRANWQYTQDWNATARALKSDDAEMAGLLDQLLDADPRFGDGQKGRGEIAFQTQRRLNAPSAEAAYLELANAVRRKKGLPPAMNWSDPLVQERPAYDPPFPDLPSAGPARNLRAVPGEVKGQAMKTKSGRQIVVFQQP